MNNEIQPEEVKPAPPVAYEDEEEEIVSVEYDEDDVPPAADDDDYDEEADDEADAVGGPSQFQPAQRASMDRRSTFRARRQLRNEVRLEEIDYKNIDLLSKFVDPRGRILSRRKTKISAKMQRRITTAIKRARHLALMPYTADHMRITRAGK